MADPNVSKVDATTKDSSNTSTTDNAESSTKTTETTQPTASESSVSRSSSKKGPRSSTGWDGKLRVEKKAVITNPEALSDPEYSDEDAPSPEQIAADEDLLDDYPEDEEVSRAMVSDNHLDE